MEDLEWKRIFLNNIREICHLSQMQVFATSYYQKHYFQLQIDNYVNDLLNRFDCHIIDAATIETQQPPKEAVPEEVTSEELSTYNGTDSIP